jgi:putative ubiquitin-RnfH superfamily antitoxin RatB of RatAB toxin-antitoxin module
MAPNDEYLGVEIAYALPESQVLIVIEVIPGTTAQEAIEDSGILQRFPQIDLSSQKIGIFGKVVELNRVLKSGDRVEIYRALIAEPKDARRRRAKKQS